METILPAQPGWSVVTPRSLHTDRITKNVGIFCEPVLAWRIETDHDNTTVLPVTIIGTISTPDIIYKTPNHTFVMPGEDFWRDKADLVEYFKDMEELR